MAERDGEALEIALVIGVHPACILASQAIAALDEDEMHIAGALLGRPVDMVKCLTNEVRVPAHAEIVIEGRILPRCASRKDRSASFRNIMATAPIAR